MSLHARYPLPTVGIGPHPPAGGGGAISAGAAVAPSASRRSWRWAGAAASALAASALALSALLGPAALERAPAPELVRSLAASASSSSSDAYPSSSSSSDVSTAVALSSGLRSECVRRVRDSQFRSLSDLFVAPERNRKRWGRGVLLIDPAYHPNVGDSMLVHGEIEFLSSLGWHGNDVIQCDVHQASGMVEKCGDFSKYKSAGVRLALWHAGGNWGSLGGKTQRMRIETFRDLMRSGFTVVGMPQSLYYENPATQEGPDLTKFRAEVAAGLGMGSEAELDTPGGREVARSRIVLTWRERESYVDAVRLYPFVDNRLIPDVAFQLGPYVPSVVPPSAMLSSSPSTSAHEKVDILLFMRSDYESTLKGTDGRSDEYVRRYLDSIPGGRGRSITFRVVDWGDRNGMFNDPYPFFSRTAIDLLASGRVVVADRLHASVLSFLSGIPFIYVDQMTKKISRTLGAAFERWDVCRDEDALMYGGADSHAGGIDAAVDMLERYSLGRGGEEEAAV